MQVLHLPETRAQCMRASSAKRATNTVLIARCQLLASSLSAEPPGEPTGVAFRAFGCTGCAQLCLVRTSELAAKRIAPELVARSVIDARHRHGLVPKVPGDRRLFDAERVERSRASGAE